MRRRAWIAPMAAAFAATLSACAVFVPEPDRADAGGSEAALQELRRGRHLYVEKCGGCHRLYDVDAYGDDAWRGHVRDMMMPFIRSMSVPKARAVVWSQRKNFSGSTGRRSTSEKLATWSSCS